MNFSRTPFLQHHSTYTYISFDLFSVIFSFYHFTRKCKLLFVLLYITFCSYSLKHQHSFGLAAPEKGVRQLYFPLLVHKVPVDAILRLLKHTLCNNVCIKCHIIIPHFFRDETARWPRASSRLVFSVIWVRRRTVSSLFFHTPLKILRFSTSSSSTECTAAILYFDDISDNPEDWRNRAMTLYYRLNSVKKE